jgi:CHAT domain-containing protein
VLLVYFLGEKRSFVWAVSDREVESAELPPRVLIEAAAMRFHSLLARSHLKGTADQLRLTAEELSALLLGQVAHRLPGKQIVVVANGALAYVPFGALPHPGDGGQPLAVQHEVVKVPSASVLAAIRERAAARPPSPGLVAVVADPIFSRDDSRLALPKGFALASKGPLPGGAVTRSVQDLGLRSLARLPFSRQEAKAILALAGPERSFGVTDSAANLALVTGGRLEDFRIVHFATHALIHPRYPELSGVVLSLVDSHGRPQPGFLRSYQIFSLHLPAELVVLSACRTGLGLELDGEGLVGLTQSFFHAGASRVVVSLWDVDDEAAARLMERFYRELLLSGRTPAAALRAAQLSLRSDPRWSAPYYWAGFVLQGDSRETR